jgi:hypothetical protein
MEEGEEEYGKWWAMDRRKRRQRRAGPWRMAVARLAWSAAADDDDATRNGDSHGVIGFV